MAPPISSSDPTVVQPRIDASTRYAEAAMSRFAAALSGLPHGVQLDDEALAKLLDATKELFLDMPPSAFNPEIAKLLKDAFPKGYTNPDQPLKKQGNVAINLIEKAAKKFWSEQTTGAKVALTAAALVALGAASGIAGTKMMEELDLPTDVDFDIIGKKLHANVGATFDSGFENASAQANVSSMLPLDGAFVKFSAGVKMVVDDPYVAFVKAGIAFSAKDGDWRVASDFSYDVAKKQFVDRLAFTANIDTASIGAGIIIDSEKPYPSASLSTRVPLVKGVTVLGSGQIGPDKEEKLSYGTKVDLVASF